MEQPPAVPPTPTPPTPPDPIPPAGSAPQKPPASPASSPVPTPAKKTPLPWILGGCGCLAILAVIGASLIVYLANSGGGNSGKATEIERKTFSMTLPKGWTEDTKDDMYEPDAFVMFENSASCLFAVVIGKKSAGATVEGLLQPQREAWGKRITDSKSTEIKTWAKYEGAGFELEGKTQGITRSRTRVFGFEEGDNVCVVIEYAALVDLKKYSGDFEKIRETFKLK